jgi:hypothetical protein
METRIKYVKKNLQEGYYAVQIKKWLFWKTIYTNTIFANVENFIDTLAKINEINSKTKSLDKIIYEGWAVRNVSKRLGNYNHLEFFQNFPTKFNDDGEVFWKNSYGSTFSDIQVRCDKLFGKECLEPMKLRITIEKLEE